MPDYLGMIHIIDDDGTGVTDWEAEFLDSLLKAVNVTKI